VPSSRFSEFNLDPALAEAAHFSSDEDAIEGIIRLEDPSQIPTQFQVVSQFTRICTGRFLAKDIWAIRQHPNVASLKAARPIGIFEAESAPYELRSDCSTCRFAPLFPFTGRGSIVSTLDFGLDFGHPNFLNPDGTTRIISFWHQGALYDANAPNRYGYGRIFLPDEINRALQTPDPYEALGYHPSISDTGNGSHGSHTLDIAAGNGGALGSHPGIAPEADLIFVHLSTPRLGVTGDLGDSVRMLEGLEFIHRTAGDRPCVVNISVGREAGSHDATSPFEQAMHELLRMDPGTNRAICQSAGNYGSADLAVNGWLQDGEKRDLAWHIHPGDISPEIDAWYSGNDRFRVELILPDGVDVVEVGLGNAADVRYKGDLIGRIYHRKNDPNNRDNHIAIFLYRGAPAGVWRLRLIGEYVITGRFHAWIERAIPDAQSHFDREITSRRYTLGTIATSPLVITVGAYDANAEGRPLAHFSSCGPTRDERQDKPELLAPGVRVVAARSIPRDAVRQEGLLIARSGTSMAAPSVTGLIAAMFQAAGRPISISEIRSCLKESADPVGEAEPLNCCAWGRLNMQSALDRVRALSPVGNPLARSDVSNSSISYTGLVVADATAHSPLELNEWEESFTRLSDEGGAMHSDISDHSLNRAEQALPTNYGGRAESEVAFLENLLRSIGARVSAPRFSPIVFLKALFSDPRWSDQIQNALEILGTPSQRAKDVLRPGDWIIRAAPGTEDVGHVSVLASDLVPQSMFVSEGIPVESEYSGLYGLVIESGAFPHSRMHPFARRVLDSKGRVPPNTLILRPRPTTLPEPSTDEPEESSIQSGSGPACSVWLNAVSSASYTDWIAGPTRGRISLLINGRDSNGVGSDKDLVEPLAEMEASVKALGADDFCYLSAWFFEPATKLTAGTYSGETTWGGLFRRKAEEGANIRILINDFDPFTRLDSWERDFSLIPLKTIVLSLSASARSKFIYLVSRHLANYAGVRAAVIRKVSGGGSGPIFIGSHHQKFMVVRRGGATTAYCGGLDIESRKTPSKWSYGGLIAWHDLTLKLEGPVTRDLERQFVERWNLEQSGARNFLLPDWGSWGTLALPSTLPTGDNAPEKKMQNVQVTRTISSDTTFGAYTNNRNDIRLAYRNIVKCASSFLYLENQYFRDLSLADEIASRGRSLSNLRAIFVVLADAAADDGTNPLTSQGTYLQHEFFARVTAAMGARAGIYTMFNRSVHAKMILADDRLMSVGSANANVRSFDLDSELNISIDDSEWTRSSRLRLWSHNLGVSQTTVESWTVSDFLSKWNNVASSNAALTSDPERMTGEGVIVFDWSLNRGASNALVPDYLVQLDIAPAPNKIYGPADRAQIAARRAFA
jgi:phosphatidylserine/phosphatidylglycerophosphate/cardiolipin synthase-like enzyme